MTPTRDVYLDTFHRDASLFATAVRAGDDLTQPVEGCDDWDLAALVGHVGTLQRFVTHAVLTGEKGAWVSPPSSRDELADWFVEGAAGLEAALRSKGDDEPCYTFFRDVPQTVGTWVRRQCHELAVHRYDAELAATGTAEAIDADIAKDGIDEYLDLFLPRVEARSPIRIGELLVHVHLTDTDGEWAVRCRADAAPVVTREHVKGDIAVVGPADEVLLALWGRLEPGEMDVELYGDLADWHRFQHAASI